MMVQTLENPLSLVLCSTRLDSTQPSCVYQSVGNTETHISLEAACRTCDLITVVRESGLFSLIIHGSV